jgi:hypothetical protein
MSAHGFGLRQRQGRDQFGRARIGQSGGDGVLVDPGDDDARIDARGAKDAEAGGGRGG